MKEAIFEIIAAHQAKAIYEILETYIYPKGKQNAERASITYEAVRALPLPMPTPTLAAVMELLADVLSSATDGKEDSAAAT